MLWQKVTVCSALAAFSHVPLMHPLATFLQLRGEWWCVNLVTFSCLIFTHGSMLRVHLRLSALVVATSAGQRSEADNRDGPAAETISGGT